MIPAARAASGAARSSAPLSPAAAAAAVAPAALPTTFARTGFTPRPAVTAELPYLRQTPMPLVDSGVHDAAGVRLVVVKGLLYNHPVAQASYGLDLLESYRITTNPVYLDRAVAQANRLVSREVVSGTAWFYPYPFDFALHGNTTEMMRAPWYSGMAQGLALSLFVRLAQTTGNPAWDAAADATYASFGVAPSATGPWVSRIDSASHLWIEEYPRWPAATSDRTMNGFQFAALGLYEYAGHRALAPAWATWDGALTTLLAAAPSAFVARSASRYCLAHTVLNAQYHLIVTNLFSFLQRESGSGRFARLVDQFTDAYPPPLAAPLTVTILPGLVTGYRYSSTGAVVARRTVRIAAASQANGDARLRIGGGGPIGLHITNGAFAGYYLAERSGAVFARGMFAPISYLPLRRPSVAAGTTLVATRLSPDGGTLGTSSATFPAVTAFDADRSQIVNGRRWIRLVSGALAGSWVPVTSVFLD